jgi:uncharacterized protein
MHLIIFMQMEKIIDEILLKEEVKKLASQIDFKPDMLVFIIRGGMIPARLLCTYLDLKDVYGITVKKEAGKRNVMVEILENLNRKKILLLEDCLETGRSLIEAKKYLEDKGATVKTAAIYTTPESEIVPDYFIKQLKLVPKFYWEKK